MAAKYEFFGEKKGFAAAATATATAESGYDKLSALVKAAFRKYFVYEMDGELANISNIANINDFTPAECLELLQFLNYSCIDTHQDYFNNLPRFRRFIHEHRGNEELTRATILIHHNPYYVIGSNDDRDVINMYCMTIGVDIRLHWKKKYEIFAAGTSAMHKHLQAICLGEQELGCDNSGIDKFELFHQNWCENQFTMSYARWADASPDNENIDDVTAQLQKNWDEKKCMHSLAALAECYRNQGKEKGPQLYLLNWTGNKCYGSLDLYGSCLTYGFGVKKNENLAEEMNKIYRSLIT
jgi:hypothetical protein